MIPDQAAALRAMMNAEPRPRPSVPSTTPVMVVGSGKGGVGKSVLSILAARSLAHQGKKVLLLEGDQNMSNLHIMLGVQPAKRLETLLYGDTTPEDLLVTVTPNVMLLPGDSGAEALYGASAIERARLHHRLSSLFDLFDVVVVDAAAGLESVVRASAIGATGLVVVTMPEPAALSDAYAVIKIVNLQVPSVPVDVIVNRTGEAAEGDRAFSKLETAASRFLKRQLGFLGSVPEDSAIRDAVRRGANLLTITESVGAKALDASVSAWLSRHVATHKSAPVAARS